MSLSKALKNPNLNDKPSDFLYHLAINVPNTKDTSDIQRQFGDVKVICMGGTGSRMLALAKYISKVLQLPASAEPVDLCKQGDRYAAYKVGPVLCVSHGIGMSSMSVVLHELLKLVKYAKCQDPVFIRIGTCGGLGVPPGTVVVTDLAYNGLLKNEHEIFILGKRVARPAQFDETVLADILKYGAQANDDFQTIKGNTMGTDCFYEGQGRIDGASCGYTEADKMQFLHKCHELGIRNIEMEATMFSSLTRHVGVKAGDVCVTLINRLEGDQVKVENKHDFEQRPFLVVGRYIQGLLNNSAK